MRRTAAAVSLSLLALAGCSAAEDEPVVLTVVTPPASATAAPPGTPAPTTDAPGTGAPDPGAPGASPGPGTAGPATVAPVPPAGGPAGAYQGLVADWKGARAAFFGAVSDGRPRTVGEQRALAASFLAAQQVFAAGLRTTAWPEPARAPVAVLLQRNGGQQRTVAAMAGAGTSAAFTARLADYGVATGPEDKAVAAVSTALGP